MKKTADLFMAKNVVMPASNGTSRKSSLNSTKQPKEKSQITVQAGQVGRA
jgi:hypothetical protein